MADSDANCEKSSDVVGKGGAQYKKHGAFCLETQKYADAIHHVSEKVNNGIEIESIENSLHNFFTFSSTAKFSINHSKPRRSVRE